MVVKWRHPAKLVATMVAWWSNVWRSSSTYPEMSGLMIRAYESHEFPLIRQLLNPYFCWGVGWRLPWEMVRFGEMVMSCHDGFWHLMSWKISNFPPLFQKISLEAQDVFEVTKKTMSWGMQKKTCNSGTILFATLPRDLDEQNPLSTLSELTVGLVFHDIRPKMDSRIATFNG